MTHTEIVGFIWRSRAVKHRRRPRGKDRNVYRYEHNGWRGWVVRIKRAGVPYVRYVKDGQAGRDISQARAVKYRDWLESRLPPWNKLHRRSATNTSGIIGVSRIIDRTRTGTRIPRWVAFWNMANGRKVKRSFSVLKYGERRAKQLAIEARRGGVAELLAARTRE
jgi:hypothetical protein